MALVIVAICHFILADANKFFVNFIQLMHMKQVIGTDNVIEANPELICHVPAFDKKKNFSMQDDATHGAMSWIW